MSDAGVATENIEEPQSLETSKQAPTTQEKSRYHHLKKLHPRRALEHLSKLNEQTRDARTFAGLLALVKEHGVDASTFAVPLLISMIPMIVGAPESVTMGAQEASLAATGALLGVDLGETGRALTGKEVPSSKKNRLKNAAIGAGSMVAAGYVANQIGGEYARAALAGGDDFLAPPVRLAARGVKKIAEKRVNRKNQVKRAEPILEASKA